jgi:hypothetical protein
MSWTESVPVVLVGIVALAGLLFDVLLRSESGRRRLQQAFGPQRPMALQVATAQSAGPVVRQRRFADHSVGLAADARHARRSRRLVA